VKRRLKPGVSLAQAQHDVDAIAAALAALENARQEALATTASRVVDVRFQKVSNAHYS
jgi:hypothetical protein